MKLKIKVLTVLGSLLLMAMALNVGTASADGGHFVGTGEDGINTAAGAGAYAPAGSHLLPEDAPGHPGRVNGFLNENSSAIDGITRNPLCPLHDGNAH